MIQLSLDSINEHDVYYVMLSPRGGYIFETDNGIHYTISFENITWRLFVLATQK